VSEPSQPLNLIDLRSAVTRVPGMVLASPAYEYLARGNGRGVSRLERASRASQATKVFQVAEQNGRRKEILPMQQIKRSRGGHAPGYLRELFENSTEGMRSVADWYEGLSNTRTSSFDKEALQEQWDRLSPKERGLWLTDQLWVCSDVMTSSLCDELGVVSQEVCKSIGG
jgi:hypothetical protein